MIETSLRNLRLARTTDIVSERLGGETDPPYVTTAENFSSWDHVRMYEAVRSIDGSRIRLLAETYNDVAALIPFGLGVAFLTATIRAHWSGQAAEAAKAAVDRLGEHGIELRESINVIGVKLHQVHDGLDAVRAAVPPPDSSAVMSLSGSRQQTAYEKNEDARLAAALALTNLYSPLYRAAGTDVPVLPAPQVFSSPGATTAEPLPESAIDRTIQIPEAPPQSVEIHPEPAVHSAAPASVSMTPTLASQGSSSISAIPGSPPPVPVPGVGSTPTNNTVLHSASATPVLGSGTTGYTASAPSVAPRSAGHGPTPTETQPTAAATTATRAAGSVGTAGSHPSHDVRAPSSRHDEAVARFRPIPVAPNSSAASVPAGVSSPTTQAPRTAAGASSHMMGAGGRGARRGDPDTEHKTPSYLVSVDNGTELIGRIAPVGPPVLS